MAANHPNADLHTKYTIKGRIGFFDVGVLFAREPPLPIPNREVKPRKPDDTCCLGGRESRVCRHQSIVCGFLFSKIFRWRIFYKDVACEPGEGAQADGGDLFTMASLVAQPGGLAGAVTAGGATGGVEVE